MNVNTAFRDEAEYCIGVLYFSFSTRISGALIVIWYLWLATYVLAVYMSSGVELKA